MDYRLPYDFVLKYLYPLRPKITKMPAGYALYHNALLLLLLRDREDRPELNGIFVATQPEFFTDMQKDLHTSLMAFDLDGSINCWIFLSEDLPDFNYKVAKACEMIKNGDNRIGIPL